MFAHLLNLLSVALAFGAPYEGGLKETYSGALHRCFSREKSIPAPSQLESVDISDGKVVWLRFQKETNFRWQKKGVPIVQEIDDTWKDTNEKTCGVYYYVDGTFEATNCSYSLNFLCELPNCSECPGTVTQCVKYDNTTYFYHKEAKNWTVAQDHCKNHSRPGYLSLNNNRTILKSIFKQLDLNEENIGKVWVNFIRIGWEIGDPTRSKELLRELNLINWEKGEPSDTGNCVLAEKNATHFAMRVADCGELHSFVCVSVGTTSPRTSLGTTISKNEALSIQGKEEEYLSTSKYTPAEAENKFTSAPEKAMSPTTGSQLPIKTRGNHNIWKVVAVTSIVILVATFIVLVLIFLCRKRIYEKWGSSSFKSRDREERNKNNIVFKGDPDMIELLEKSETNSTKDGDTYDSADANEIVGTPNDDAVVTEPMVTREANGTEHGVTSDPADEQDTFSTGD